MQKLQLYIGGQRVDLFKDETVTLNQTIQNIKDPAKIFVEFTKDFTIPASKVNNQIFRHFNNYDITTNFYDARFKTAAEIQLNYIPFKKGFVKLEGVDLKLNNPYAYRIVFYGQTVSLKDIIGDDKLQSLTQLDNYNLTYSSANVEARLKANIGNIIAPLITSGASNEDNDLNPSRLYYNSQTHNVVDGNLFFHNTGSKNGVLWSDLKYAIRLNNIISAIENQYTDITFSTDFFNSTNEPYYDLFMWLHRKKGSVEPAEQIQSFPTLVTEFQPSINNGVYTTMLSGTTLEVYSSCNPYSGITCPNTSLPSIQQTLTLSPNTNDFYDVVISRNSVTWSSHIGLNGTRILTRADMPIMDQAQYTVTIFVASGVNLTFGTIEWELSGYLTQSGWSETYITTTNAVQADASIDFVIRQQIPEMGTLEFLTSIFQMFNLTAYYVENPADPDYQKIKVQTLDEFYATYNTYDISKYIDINSSSVDAALPYREINFSYEGTETFLAKQYNQLTGKLWAAEEFTGDSTTNGDSFDGNNSSYSIQIPIEHVLNERLVDANTNLTPSSNKTSIQYAYFVDDNQDAYYGKPLLFYPILINNTKPNYKSIAFRDTPSTHKEVTSYFIPSNSVNIDPSITTSNINFYEETNEYTPNGTFSGTLFANYYRNYIRSIFTINRRLIKVKAYLPLKILYNFTLNDVFTINNRSFNINSIETNLQTGESNIELLNNFSQQSLELSDLFIEEFQFTGYYSSAIGNAENLAVGDIIYSDSNLATLLNTGTTNQYNQLGTGETTTHCTSGGGYTLVMNLDASSVITSISCQQV